MESPKEAVSKSFNQPDEDRQFQGHGHLEIVKLGDNLSMGRGIFDPGWRWSNDVKPIAQTPSCEAEHVGYCISGRMVVRMDDGREIRIEPGQAFHLAPGHDAWVEGDEPCVLLDFVGFKDYAVRKEARKTAA